MDESSKPSKLSENSAYSFYWLIGAPLLFALTIFILFDLTPLDVYVSDLLFDAPTGHFLLQNNLLFQEITFRWTRLLPDLVEKLAMGGAVLSLLSVWQLKRQGASAKLAWFAIHQRDFVYVVVAFTAGTWLIQFLKIHTGVGCPVEWARYGGEAAEVQWFRQFSLTHSWRVGRCWPGGHAAVGFNLLCLYHVALRHRWRHRRLLLGGILLMGGGIGAIRTMQGWHLLSHTLWSAVLVWFCVTLLAQIIYWSPIPSEAPAKLTG